MKEYVGNCAKCKKAIYCMDGFIEGMVTDEHVLYCFSCHREKVSDEDK